jgi:hypothetical protein
MWVRLPPETPTKKGKLRMVKECDHQYVKVSDVIMKSPLEIIMETQKMDIHINQDFISQCHVVILVCDLCGHVHKEVTYNPPK